MANPIYLDANASAPTTAAVRAAISAALECGLGNPASDHLLGNSSRAALERARTSLASLINAAEENITFTSGGTEANALVLTSFAALASDRPRIVTTKAEHASILRTLDQLNDVEVRRIPLSPEGLADVEWLQQLPVGPPTLVTVHWVNNETGVVQPVSKLRAVARERGFLFHTDAAQAIGKLDANVAELAPDYLTLTGHKLHAPPGVGAVVARPKLLRAMWGGGGQEGGSRPGTENLLGAIALGAAADERRMAIPAVAKVVGAMRDRLEAGLKGIDGAWINGQGAERIWNTTNVGFEGASAAAVLAQLASLGVCASTGSACESGRPEPSHVLRAMGLDEPSALSSLRFSLSPLNTEAEIDSALEAIKHSVERVRSFGSKMQEIT
ncbi:MAG: cysteine desulfurase [Planctomycetes bacterium]|nr:cysteine desulfurase [Planctomycetota bacterium]